jgi:AcrR family transcriptional regulator
VGQAGAGRAAPAPYHHGDLRQALLAAAQDLLERQGAAALSLREVARAAGVSHNAPYRHFADREALLAALAAAGFARLAAEMEVAAATAPPAGRLRAAGRAYLGFAAAHRPLFLLMFGPGIRKSRHPALAEAAAGAMAVLQRAAAEGSPGAARAPRAAAIGAWALVHGLAHLIADGQIAEDPGADGHAALAAEAMAIYGAGLSAASPAGRQAR